MELDAGLATGKFEHVFVAGYRGHPANPVLLDAEPFLQRACVSTGLDFVSLSSVRNHHLDPLLRTEGRCYLLPELGIAGA